VDSSRIASWRLSRARRAFQLLGPISRALQLHAGDQVSGCQLLVRLGPPPHLTVFGLETRDRGLLGKPLRLERRLEVDELCLGLGQLPLRVERLQLNVRVGHLEKDVVRRDLVPGVHVDLLDPPTGGGRHPAGALRHQGAGAAHGADHLPVLDRVGPDGGAIDARSGRLQPCQRDGDEGDDENAPSDHREATDLLVLRRGAWNIQRS